MAKKRNFGGRWVIGGDGSFYRIPNPEGNSDQPPIEIIVGPPHQPVEITLPSEFLFLQDIIDIRIDQRVQRIIAEMLTRYRAGKYGEPRRAQTIERALSSIGIDVGVAPEGEGGYEPHPATGGNARRETVGPVIELAKDTTEQKSSCAAFCPACHAPLRLNDDVFCEQCRFQLKPFPPRPDHSSRARADTRRPPLPLPLRRPAPSTAKVLALIFVPMVVLSLVSVLTDTLHTKLRPSSPQGLPTPGLDASTQSAPQQPVPSLVSVRPYFVPLDCGDDFVYLSPGITKYDIEPKNCWTNWIVRSTTARTFSERPEGTLDVDIRFGNGKHSLLLDETPMDRRYFPDWGNAITGFRFRNRSKKTVTVMLEQR